MWMVTTLSFGVKWSDACCCLLALAMAFFFFFPLRVAPYGSKSLRQGSSSPHAPVPAGRRLLFHSSSLYSLTSLIITVPHFPIILLIISITVLIMPHTLPSMTLLPLLLLLAESTPLPFMIYYCPSIILNCALSS